MSNYYSSSIHSIIYSYLPEKCANNISKHTSLKNICIMFRILTNIIYFMQFIINELDE
jgi:hypothetical protein